MQMADKRLLPPGGVWGGTCSARTTSITCATPGAAIAEYSSDIDYIPVDCDWDAGDHPAEDSLYLWGPELPKDFIVNYEADTLMTEVSAELVAAS